MEGQPGFHVHLHRLPLVVLVVVVPPLLMVAFHLVLLHRNHPGARLLEALVPFQAKKATGWNAAKCLLMHSKYVKIPQKSERLGNMLD